MKKVKNFITFANFEEKYIVRTSSGEPVTVVNPELVKQQNISDDELALLKESHALLYEIYSDMARTDDKTTLRALASKCTEIEFIQQRLWHFDEDATFHNWYKVPNCTCPMLDNMERRGTPYQIINHNCIIHGD